MSSALSTVQITEVCSLNSLLFRFQQLQFNVPANVSINSHFEHQPNEVRTWAGLGPGVNYNDFVKTFLGRHDQWANDLVVNPFVAFMALHANRPTISVDSFAMGHYLEHGTLQNYLHPFNIAGNDNWELALLPIHISDHWMVAAFDRVANVIYFMDPFVRRAEMRGHPSTRITVPDALRAIARQLTGDAALNPQIRSATEGSYRNAQEAFRINRQDDGTSCGYRICLFVENFLREGTPYIYNLNIHDEIDRIHGILDALWTSDTYPAYYPPQRQQPAPQVFAHDSDEEETPWTPLHFTGILTMVA